MKTPSDIVDSNAMSKHSKKAVLFVGLTFLVNWSLALLFYVLGECDRSAGLCRAGRRNPDSVAARLQTRASA